ncbi:MULTISPECIES: RraA family protein [unclassified Sedimentibacter]|uniref:RraA family protein n=1 Tax=unclassified Sedimentibacter TaxID=2649220 RepID=UPI0027DF5866|nr:RraA family protein [Sedimentibacter sp. MB35-C1]WMJ76881.1 RraA family protein [Sedimentibacter sp. MB35-C1]
MNNVGNQIIMEFQRPPKELVEAFRGIPVANIGDCMNRLSAIDADINSMNGLSLCGTAYTIRVPAGDNLYFHKAMDLAKPGDIIVIDAGGGKERAILGELMASYCRSRGIAGIVVDGCVRDADAIGKMDFPVFSRGCTPNGPYKNGPGEINVPVVVGGKIINPGDIVVGDRDGVIAINPSEAPAILKAVKQLEEKEAKLLELIQNDGIYDRPWVDEKLKEIGCNYK